MKRYEAYKDSGVDWIGEIPKEWDVIKIKRFSKTLAGGTPSTDNLKFWDGNIPWLPSGKLQNCDIYSAEKFITELGLSKSATKYIRENTTLIALTGATCANIGYLKFKATANQSVVAIENDENQSNSRFLFYALMNERPRILLNQTGGAQAGINENDVKNILITFPPLPEQTAIAEFLDDKTAKIDQLIGIKQKEIELLKERRQILIQQAVTGKIVWDESTNAWTEPVEVKDSGVDWIGEIPEHWEVRKLKSFCTAFGRIGFRGYTTADLVDEGDGAITISPSNIKETNMEFNSNSYLSWFKYNESPEIKIRENDILIVKTGSTYGKIGIVKNLPQKATINPQLLVLKKIQIKADYLYELLKSEIFQLQVERNVIGSTIPTISETKILGFSVPIPTSEEEINEISDYILNINEKIAKAITLKEQEIEKLKEYKMVLIDNVVTGKGNVMDNV